MKDFFEQCMKDLEALTGIRQLAFMEMEAGRDPIEAKRKLDICIAGMVEVSKQFSYISEEDQKRIISDQMKKDQEYQSLNSRTIWKWLNMFKDVYWTESHKEEVKHEPAPPEVADRYIKELQENLSKVGNPQVVNGMKKIREELGVKAVSNQFKRQKYLIEGFEVWAVSEEEAKKAYETFKSQQ